MQIQSNPSQFTFDHESSSTFQMISSNNDPDFANSYQISFVNPLFFYESQGFFPLNKTKRIYTKKTTEKIKRWTKEESQLYEEFLQKYKNIFEEAGTKRMTKIFILMSEFIGTKTASQCRSHHQKFFKKIKNAEINGNTPQTYKKRVYKKRGQSLEDTTNTIGNDIFQQSPPFLGFPLEFSLKQHNESMQTNDETSSNRFSNDEFSYKEEFSQEKESFECIPVKQWNFNHDYEEKHGFFEEKWGGDEQNNTFSLEFEEENIGKYLSENQEIQQ